MHLISNTLLVCRVKKASYGQSAYEKLYNRIRPFVMTDFLPELRTAESVTVTRGTGAGGLTKEVLVLS